MAFYRPAHQTQLDDGTPTAARNCAVHALSMAIDGGTHGAVVPTVAQVRKAAGNPLSPIDGKPGGLSTQDYKEVLEALLPASVDRHYYVRPAPIRLLRDDLKAGFGVVLAVDYEMIPKPYTGQASFDGNHALYLLGWRWVQDLRQVRDFDALFDHRRAGIPDGPQLVPLRILIAAAEKYAGGPNLFAGASVMRAVK